MPADAAGKLVAVVAPSDGVAELTKANNRATLYLGRDTMPPALTVPADITKEATSPAGAPVAYSASASDERDPNPVVSCAPASGAIFGLGSTTVTCTATDASGNVARASFVVRVVDTIAPVLSLPPRRHEERHEPCGRAGVLLGLGHGYR